MKRACSTDIPSLVRVITFARSRFLCQDSCSLWSARGAAINNRMRCIIFGILICGAWRVIGIASTTQETCTNNVATSRRYTLARTFKGFLALRSLKTNDARSVSGSDKLRVSSRWQQPNLIFRGGRTTAMVIALVRTTAAADRRSTKPALLFDNGNTKEVMFHDDDTRGRQGEENGAYVLACFGVSPHEQSTAHHCPAHSLFLPVLSLSIRTRWLRIPGLILIENQQSNRRMSS